MSHPVFPDPLCSLVFPAPYLGSRSCCACCGITGAATTSKKDRRNPDVDIYKVAVLGDRIKGVAALPTFTNPNASPVLQHCCEDLALKDA